MKTLLRQAGTQALLKMPGQKRLLQSDYVGLPLDCCCPSPLEKCCDLRCATLPDPVVIVFTVVSGTCSCLNGSSFVLPLVSCADGPGGPEDERIEARWQGAGFPDCVSQINFYCTALAPFVFPTFVIKPNISVAVGPNQVVSPNNLTFNILSCDPLHLKTNNFTMTGTTNVNCSAGAVLFAEIIL